MFTEESFRAVRDHLKPRGVMALYNYFREKWLVDRLANTRRRRASVSEPLGHVHQERAYLAVMLAGPRARRAGVAAAAAEADAGVRRSRSAPKSGAARWYARRHASRRPPTTGRFSTCANRACRAHYLAALAVVLVDLDNRAGHYCWRSRDPAIRRPFDIRNCGVSCALLLPGRRFHAARNRSRSCSSRCYGDRRGRRHRWPLRRCWSWQLVSAFVAITSSVAAVAGPSSRTLLVALLALNYLLPVGRVAFGSRARGIALLRRARLQPGAVRGPAVQFELQAVASRPPETSA